MHGLTNPRIKPLSKTFTFWGGGEQIHSFSHCERFWDGYKRLDSACAVFPTSISCPFTPAPATSKSSGQHYVISTPR